jgi:hypothetical protein
MPNETVEITVQFVNPVKPGKKWGSIKTSEGQMFGCPPNMLKMFSPGEVCTIEYEVWDSGGMGIKKKIGTTKAPPLSPPPPPPPRQRTNPIDTENMFVTALLKSFIEAGKIELSTTDIVAAIQDIKKAYRFTSTEKQVSDDLNDSVDY